MFTGIITAFGTVVDVDRRGERLSLRIRSPYPNLEVGESVAVAGACLTVVEVAADTFCVDAIVTTRGRTRLGDLEAGAVLNLERALAVGDRLGGHFVQGHVDAVAAVTSVREEGDALLVDVRVPDEIAELSVLHGSIAVEGVSMTVNAIPAPGVVQLSLIPFTRAQTTLGALRPGDKVHVEGDMLGKFVRQLMRKEN